jgi:hypothetical protein
VSCTNRSALYVYQMQGHAQTSPYVVVDLDFAALLAQTHLGPGHPSPLSSLASSPLSSLASSPLTSLASSPANSPHPMHQDLPLESQDLQPLQPLRRFKTTATGTSSPPTSLQSQSTPRSKNTKSHARRRRARQVAKASQGPKPVRLAARRKHTRAADPIEVALDANTFEASSSGYIGRAGAGGRRVFHIHEVVGEHSKYGLRLVDWDGK